MDDLIARVTGALGVDAATAQQAVGAVLGFLQKEGPAAEVGELLNGIPGSEDAIAAAPSAGGGGLLGGLLGGGGIMGLASQLQGLGLGMGEIQELGKQLFAYGRETVGEETMGKIVASVPGLSQFV